MRAGSPGGGDTGDDGVQIRAGGIIFQKQGGGGETDACGEDPRLPLSGRLYLAGAVCAIQSVQREGAVSEALLQIHTDGTGTALQGFRGELVRIEGEHHAGVSATLLHVLNACKTTKAFGKAPHALRTLLLIRGRARNLQFPDDHGSHVL